jgi:hypothetical protein
LGKDIDSVGIFNVYVLKVLLSCSDLENRILNRTDEHKLEKITRARRKLLNETVHILCPSPKVIQAMEPNMVGWVSHVTCVGERLQLRSKFGGVTKGPLEISTLDRSIHIVLETERMLVRKVNVCTLRCKVQGQVHPNTAVKLGVS